jgi:hypothetical protein
MSEINWGALGLVQGLVLALAAFIVVWATTGPRPRTALLAGFSGALGIVSGYFLYAYVSEKAAEKGALLHVLGPLLIVGVMSFVFEVVRHEIEGHEEPWPVRRVFSTILILAVFELYIVAWHHGLEQKPEALSHITQVIFGEHFAAQLGPGWNLIVLGALWVAVGIAVAGRLRGYILGMSETPLGDPESDAARRWPDPRTIGRGARAGFVAAVVWAPVMVLGYVVLVRAWLMVEWLRADYPAWWRQSAEWLLDWTVALPPLRALLWLALAAVGNLAYHGHVVGLVLGLALVIGLGWGATTAGEWLWGVPFLAAGAVLLIPLLVNLLLTGDSLWNLARLCGLAMFIWGVPAVLLGILAPFLRQPATQPRLWGGLAFGAAVVLAAAVVIGTHGGGLTRLEAGVVVGLAVFFVVTGALLWRGPWVTEFWPVLGLSVATLVWAGTSMAQTIDLLYLQRVAYSLISVPLSGPAPTGLAAIPWGDPWRGLDHGPMAGASSTRELLGPCEALGPELDARIERVRAGAAMAERGRARLRGGVASLRGKADGIAAAVEKLKEEPPNEATPKGEKPKAERIREGLEHQQALVAAGRKDVAALGHDIGTLDARLQAGAAERVAVPGREDCRPVLGPRQTALRQELATRVLAYGRVLEQLGAIRRDLKQAGDDLDATGTEIDTRLNKIRTRLAQQLELAVTASFGFWTTVGMLAMWSLLDRGGRTAPHA